MDDGKLVICVTWVFLTLVASYMVGHIYRSWDVLMAMAIGK